MRIVIDISELIYEHAKEQSEDSYDEWDAMRAIANGIPLPEEYGRLGDLDALETLMRYEVLKHDLNEYGCLGLVSCAPTIIGKSDAE